MAAKELVRTFVELAKELGTTVRSLNRWCIDLPDEHPQPESGWHSVTKWRAFMRERGLGCYSLRQNAPFPPASASASEPTDSAPSPASPTGNLADAITDFDLAKLRISRFVESMPDQNRRNAGRLVLGRISEHIAMLYDLAGIPDGD